MENLTVHHWISFIGMGIGMILCLIAFACFEVEKIHGGVPDISHPEGRKRLSVILVTIGGGVLTLSVIYLVASTMLTH